MITEDLIFYIQKQLRKGITEETIIERLQNAGWLLSDIQEGLAKINPIVEKPLEVAPTENKVVESFPIEKTTVVEEQYLEIKAPEKNIVPVVEAIKNPELKVWIPTTTKPVVETYKPKENIAPIVVSVEKNNLSFGEKDIKSQPISLTNELASSELFPTLSKKENSSNVSSTEMVRPVEPSIAFKAMPEMPQIKQVDSLVNNFSPLAEGNKAILSSYPKDVMSLSRNVTPVPSQKKKSLLFLIPLIGIVLCVFAYALYAFGYLNFPIIKKDPKMAALRAVVKPIQNQSYKVDSVIHISFPSISNLTQGLISGEAVSSGITDTITITTKGKVDTLNSEKVVFDHQASLQSTLLPDVVSTNIKSDGDILYVRVPVLNKIFGMNAPPETWVSLSQNKIDIFIKELPVSVQDFINKVDVYRIRANGVPMYVQKQISVFVEDFISQSDIDLKGTEDIGGVSTYHYSVVADRKMTKDLLTKVAKLFITDLSDEAKSNLDEVLGSIVFDSIDIWVGVKDDNLYQVKYSAHVPVSKLIDINDKSIADGQLYFDWKTTYYDLGVKNTQNLPTESMSIESYSKLVHNLKIKDALDTFRVRAKNFKNIFGNFGRISNSSGSCLSPTGGSLFSPTGHSNKGAIVVGDIADIMKTILERSDNNSLCYSNGSAWAIASDFNDGTYYCIDSTGSAFTSTEKPTSPVCKRND